MNVLQKFSGTDLAFLAENLQRPWRPIENMTRNYYFRAAKYALSGIDGGLMSSDCAAYEYSRRVMGVKALREGVNPDIFMSDDVGAYNKYTIGWVGDAIDNFGTIVNPDCPIEFRKWHQVYAYSGGHPFEIYPYICLYVVLHRDDKFYLSLSDFGRLDPCPSERVIKMFIAMRRAGIEVVLRDREALLKKMHKYNLLNR